MSKAFSLIELSITLLILGIMSIGYLQYQKLQSLTKADYALNNKIEVIENAFTVFLATNGRLPCPASPSQINTDSTFAREQLSTSSSPATCITNNTDIASLDLSGDFLYYGAIPTRSLGIDDEYMLDEYGSRFGYFVQQSNVNNNTTNSSCVAGNSAQDIHTSQYICFRGQASNSTNPSTADMNVYNGYQGSLITGDSVYFIVSYGENRYGGYLRSADNKVDSAQGYQGNSIRAPFPSSKQEQMNTTCDTSTSICNNTTLTTDRNDFEISTQFHQKVLYKTRNQMLSDCNSYFNNICTTTHDIQSN